MILGRAIFNILFSSHVNFSANYSGLLERILLTCIQYWGSLGYSRCEGHGHGTDQAYMHHPVVVVKIVDELTSDQ